MKKYVVYWYHTSLGTYGNKAKYKLFEDINLVYKFQSKLENLEKEGKTYQQGKISLIANNF